MKLTHEIAGHLLGSLEVFKREDDLYVHSPKGTARGLTDMIRVLHPLMRTGIDISASRRMYPNSLERGLLGGAEAYYDAHGIVILQQFTASRGPETTKIHYLRPEKAKEFLSQL